MNFAPRLTSLISDRRSALIRHPFLTWLSGLEREVAQQPYGSDLFLSAAASRRFQIGWDARGQVVVAVNHLDRAGFASMNWVGAGLFTNAVRPGSEDEWDWLLLVANMAGKDTSPAVPGDDDLVNRNTLGLWLPANVNLLSRILSHARSVNGATLRNPTKMRLVSVAEGDQPEPASNSGDISYVPLSLYNGGYCTVPNELQLPRIQAPRPSNFSSASGKPRKTPRSKGKR